MAKKNEVQYPLILGRKNCARCTRWRHAVDFRWRWLKSGAGPYIDKFCIPCRKELDRQAYARMSPAQKQRKIKRDYELKYEARHALDALLAELEQHPKNELLRRKIYNVNVILNNGSGKYKRADHVDITPFRMWILVKVREYGSAVALANAIGHDEKQVRRWAEGVDWFDSCDPRPIRGVSLGTVDAIMTRLEIPHVFNELYPFVEELE